MVITKEEFESYNDVDKAFIALQGKIHTLLKKANYYVLRRACIAQMHNPGAPKLSHKLVEKYQQDRTLLIFLTYLFAVLFGVGLTYEC